jgi:hypothetical protein
MLDVVWLCFHGDVKDYALAQCLAHTEVHSTGFCGFEFVMIP